MKSFTFESKKCPGGKTLISVFRNKRAFASLANAIDPSQYLE